MHTHKTKHLGLLLISPIFLFLLSCSGSQDQKVDSFLGFDVSVESLDKFLTDKMEEYDMPGLTVAFINEGKVVHNNVFGYANREKGILVTEKTIFEAASLSKSVFAHFVMTYVEAGKLDLDKPLYEYMPYPDIAHDERYKKITARMVLSHRSGFPNWRTDYEKGELFIQFDPGTDYSYSGEGYQYLAKVLKHIDQTDWEGLEANFQRLIAQPMGLEHTVFIQDEFAKTHKAEPYDEDGQWISPEQDVDSLTRYQFVAPASIHSESLDFSKWMISLMNKEILTEASYEELYKNHSDVGDFDGIEVKYTLGFFKPILPIGNFYSHGGNNYGFNAFFVMDVEKDWGIVLFTNSEYGEKLGADLFLHMLAGPIDGKIYAILALFAILLLTGLVFFVRFIVQKISSRQAA